MDTTILGDSVQMPVGISPTAFQKLANDEGELATARAAEKAGVIYTMSCMSTSYIADVVKAAPRGTKWLQLYIFKEREITVDLVRKAEQNGFKALVLTVDSPTEPISYVQMRDGQDYPNHFG